MLKDGRTDDGRKVITIAHPEQSSGELKTMHTFENLNTEADDDADADVDTDRRQHQQLGDNISSSGM